MALPQFIYDADTETPEQLAKRRALAEAMLARGTGGIASNVGEGLAQLGQALAGRIALSRADGALKKRTAGANKLIPGMLEALRGMGGNTPANDVASSPTPKGGDTELAGKIGKDLVAQLGLSPEAAAGIVGNLSHETGGFKNMQEINPVVPGSRGGYGWAQWTGPRRKEFEAYAARNGLDPNSYEANFGNLKRELTETPEGKVLAALKGAKDPATAAQIFSEQFLRPGIPHMGSRVSRAQQIAALLKGGQGSDGLGGGSGADMLASQPPQPGLSSAMVPAPQQPPATQQIATGGEMATPVPASAPPPMQGASPPMSAYARMMRNSMDKGGAPEAVMRRMEGTQGATGGSGGIFGMMGLGQRRQPMPAPEAAMAPEMASAPAPGAPQQPGSRLAQIEAVIADPDFVYLDPDRKKFVMDAYEREYAAANPEPMSEMDRLKLERERLELEQLKNPPTKPDYTILTPEEKRTLGIPENVPVQRSPEGKLEPIKDLIPEPTKPGYRVATPEEKAAAGIPANVPAQISPEGKFEPIKVDGGGITVTSPDGTVMSVGGSGKPMTEGQSKDTTYATRAEGALVTLDKYDTALTSVFENAGGKLPLVGNYLKSLDYEKAENAGLEFLQAILRKDTGAAITAEETAEYGKVYLPQPGNSPELVKQKKVARARALAALKAGMTPDAILAQEKALAAGQNQQAVPGAVPAPGESSIDDLLKKYGG